MGELPRWIAEGEDRRARYLRARHQATPTWADHDEMAKLYHRAAELRRKGQDVHVDHLVPLRHPYVCGLHVPWNLEITGAQENMIKGNSTWPDMWCEPLYLELPCFLCGPYQYELPI